MTKSVYLFIFVTVFISITIFQGCKLINYKPSTCGYHMFNDLDFPENVIYLKDFSMYAKPGKNAEENISLNKGEYCFHYYHCVGTEPVKAKLELFDNKSGETICVVDFSLAKKENIYFTIQKTGTYRIVVQADAKRNIYFDLCRQNK